MQKAGATPHLVFDGKRKFPGKQGVDAKRAAEREAAQHKVDAALGLFFLSKATLRTAVKTTEELVSYLISEYIEPKKIAYTVAPYEADAQIAYLANATTANTQSIVWSLDGDYLAHEVDYLCLSNTKLQWPKCVKYEKKDFESPDETKIQEKHQWVCAGLVKYGMAFFRIWGTVCGCDYAKVKGEGPTSVKRYLQNPAYAPHDSRESLVKYMDRPRFATKKVKGPMGGEVVITYAEESVKALIGECSDCWLYAIDN